MDSFREFRRNLFNAGLEDSVVPIVASTALTARHWRTPLGMVFIDGGHSLDAALGDYHAWSPHIIADGILAIHDIFPDPAQGGQAPYTIWKLAQESGLFTEMARTKSLGLLRRIV